MITVRGRELIIPESERQIGTQYDSNSEVRQIKVSRLTAGGVDISHLDFRLDLRYGNEKKESERQIGTQYDSNSEVRQIKVSRLTAGGVDISHLDFRLDLRYGNEKKDTALLDKEISDEDIILTWTVGPNSVKEVGTVWIAVRGSDDFGKVKWATNQGYLYVGKTIDTPSGEGVDLTEMEELEKRLDQKTAELDFGKVKWATNQGYLYVGKTIDTPSGEGVDLTEMEELEKRLDQKTAELDTAEKKRVEAENIREENEQQRLNNEREWQIQGEKAVQAAKDAQAAASAAEKEKTVAMEYATAAGGSADDARQYAEAASTSAVNADASAKRAEEIAEGLGSYDGTAASVTAVDTHNFTGTGAGKKSTVQALLDKIAQKLIEKVVTSDTFQTVLAKYLVNNGLTTEAGKFGLDAAFGKNLQDQITEQNSNIPSITFTIRPGLRDILDPSNKSGVYETNLAVLNLPLSAYGRAIISKNQENKWIYVEFLPTDLSTIYFNFYNGYSDIPGWIGWKKIPFQSI